MPRCTGFSVRTSGVELTCWVRRCGTRLPGESWTSLATRRSTVCRCQTALGSSSSVSRRCP